MSSDAFEPTPDRLGAAAAAFECTRRQRATSAGLARRRSHLPTELPAMFLADIPPPTPSENPIEFLALILCGLLAVFAVALILRRRKRDGDDAKR